jgi:hypothetical protein
MIRRRTALSATATATLTGLAPATWAQSKKNNLVLTRWDGFRDVNAIALRRVTIRFISDAAAQVAALLKEAGAMLAKVGIVAKQENVEWAQWPSGVDDMPIAANDRSALSRG